MLEKCVQNCGVAPVRTYISRKLHLYGFSMHLAELDHPFCRGRRQINAINRGGQRGNNSFPIC